MLLLNILHLCSNTFWDNAVVSYAEVFVHTLNFEFQ